MAVTDKTTGGRCLCGAVTFTTQGDPRFVAHCHCQSCRRQTGSIPATFVGFAEAQVEYLQNGTQLQEYQSSAGIFRAFCGNCGSALHYRPAADKELHLYLGAFDQPDQFAASRHVFYGEHIAGYELYDNLPRFTELSGQPTAWGALATVNVLFLCTANSARSIIAEATMNRYSIKGVRGFSAGSTPSGTVHPGALAELQKRNMLSPLLHSKSWHEFTASQAPTMDYVITLCDNAAAESCPVMPGTQTRLHWGLPDPAAGHASFAETCDELELRIRRFMQQL